MRKQKDVIWLQELVTTIMVGIGSAVLTTATATTATATRVMSDTVATSTAVGSALATSAFRQPSPSALANPARSANLGASNQKQGTRCAHFRCMLKRIHRIEIFNDM